jgi:ABC-type polysaccharide/polyol phosphate transport system ATPase subunit
VRYHSDDLSHQKEEVDYNDVEEKNTVEKEKRRVIQNLKHGIQPKGLRIIKLGKVYSKYPCGIKSQKDFQALKDVYLEVEQNELFAILGHNGSSEKIYIFIYNKY